MLRNNLNLQHSSGADDLLHSLNDKQSWFHQLGGGDRAAEWIVDCYRMRVDDDAVYGATFRGMYAISDDDDVIEQALDLTKDFLLFFKLAVKQQVVPDHFPYASCLRHHAPNLLLLAFEKSDAKEKWGGENVFSAGPSLRRTAELVYGTSCMSDNRDETTILAEEELVEDIAEKLQYDGEADYDLEAAAEPTLFDDVGGKPDWVALWKALQQHLLEP